MMLQKREKRFSRRN